MSQIQSHQTQKGFTLVELAIVMIIIGLLIGGVLKGQELIANAQVTSTIGQMEGYQGAAATFRDSYNAMPGDMDNPNQRLPNCNGLCATAGNTDGRLNNQAGGAPALNQEGTVFWAHMNAANLISGVNPQSNNLAFGDSLPSADVGGGFTIGFDNNGTLPQLIGNPARGGHWMSLQGSPNAGNGAGASLHLAPTIAARIDRKADDGSPVAGDVRASGPAGRCAEAAVDGIYIEAVEDVACNMYYRLQL